MELRQRLDRIREGFEQQAPPEAIAIMHRATESLRASNILRGVVKEGHAAPAFELASSKDGSIRLDGLLGRGPLVLTFFRGHW